jgi:hypothetical protein
MSPKLAATGAYRDFYRWGRLVGLGAGKPSAAARRLRLAGARAIVGLGDLAKRVGNLPPLLETICPARAMGRLPAINWFAMTTAKLYSANIK